MLNREELRLEAIAGCERELKSLDNFAENEGHSNYDVMLAVAIRIADLENQIEKLKNA